MAIMHPSDISKKKHVYSEKKLFEALKNQLGPKYHVFFSVRWYSEDELGNREDSECDFLIYNPDYGFLCIEAKGGKSIYVDENDDWFLVENDGDRKLKKSPYFQAEQSMRFFKKYYEDELQTRFPGVYGAAVAFPNFVVSTPLTMESPLELTIDLEDMNQLQKRIVEIFRYYSTNGAGKSSFMSPDAQKKFINLINKRIALSVAAGALIEEKNKELEEINQVQDVIIDLLENYPRAFIIGGAGTGKTWIGMKKINRAILSGKKSLYLCNNSVLVGMAKTVINNAKADIYTIEDLATELLGNLYADAPIVDGCREFTHVLDRIPSLPKYDLIVVDEAQDFTEDWAFFVNEILAPNGSLYVLYDENQNVYSRSFGDKFFIDSPPFVLKYNIRNTSNIYQYTKEKTNLGLDTMSNQIEGVEPEYRSFEKKTPLINYLDSIVSKLVKKEGVDIEKITILTNREYEDSVLSGIDHVGGFKISLGAERMTNAISYCNVKDYKGLESDIVIFLNHTYKSESFTPDIRSIHYTALTRARFYLYVVDYYMHVEAEDYNG